MQMQQLRDILVVIALILVVALMVYCYYVGKAEGRKEAYREIVSKRRNASYAQHPRR